MLGWGRAEGLSDLRWSGPPSTWAQLGPIESLGDMEDVSLAGHVCSCTVLQEDTEPRTWACVHTVGDSFSWRILTGTMTYHCSCG